jgi:DNA recombination protein RmuC
MDAAQSIFLLLLLGVFVLLSVVIALLLRKPQGKDATLIAVMTEKIGALTDKVSQIEKNQNRTDQGIGAIIQRQIETSTRAENLIGTTNEIHRGISSAVNNLISLDVRIEERQEIERQTAESIKKLETIIAGTHSKGVAGENILEQMFANLPDDWMERNFTVDGRRVEFAFRLHNKLVLPIDSKWPATDLLERYVKCNDSPEKQKLKGEIEKTVRNKASEVKKYIDHPARTVDFGIAAVPDAIYDVCCGIRTDVFKSKVLLVSYSMLVPYLLLIYQTNLKTSQNIDLKQLGAHLSNAEEGIKDMQKELDGRFAGAITRLNNSRHDMHEYLGKVARALTSLHIDTPDSINAMPTSESSYQLKEAAAANFGDT